jgi:hypothetical protein
VPERSAATINRGETSGQLRATDEVTLGATSIRTSRLVFGTGSSTAEQRQLGVPGLARLLRQAHDLGIRWWETADIYQTHPHVAAALRRCPRDQVAITTKTVAKDKAAVAHDVDRFLKELGTDYIDVLLLHCMSTEDWTRKMAGPMEALNDAKAKGKVRAIGCSLHVHDPRLYASLAPLVAACHNPWGDILLVRLNPFAIQTDARRVDDVPRVETIFRALDSQGKILYGMKVLGGADPHVKRSRIQGARIDESLRFVLERSYIRAFTIGFSRLDDIKDIIRRIDNLAVPLVRRPAGGGNEARIDS